MLVPSIGRSRHCLLTGKRDATRWNRLERGVAQRRSELPRPPTLGTTSRLAETNHCAFPAIRITHHHHHFRCSRLETSQPAQDVRFMRGFRRLRAANHLRVPRTRRTVGPVARNSLTRRVSRGVRRNVASLASPLPYTISDEGR